MKISSASTSIPQIERTPMPSEVRHNQDGRHFKEIVDRPNAGPAPAHSDVYESSLPDARLPMPPPTPPYEAAPLPPEQMPPLVNAGEPEVPEDTLPDDPQEAPEERFPRLHPGEYYRHFAGAAREAQERRIERFEASGKLAKFAEHAARHPHAERYEQLLAYRDQPEAPPGAEDGTNTPAPEGEIPPSGSGAEGAPPSDPIL